MKKVLLLSVIMALACVPAMAQAPVQDEFGFWVFDRGCLKPIEGCCPQYLCIDVALRGVTQGTPPQKVMDPVTGCQKVEYDWTNSSFMWRKIPWSSGKVFVQSVTLEKFHIMRKGACNLVWKNDYIRQQGKEYDTSEINLCWPLLYETHGTKWVLSIVYQTNPAMPDPSGRAKRVHKERYVWTVCWNAPDFSNFRTRLMFFSRMPAGQCELFVVPPLKLREILWVLDSYGCPEFNTYDPGITALLSLAANEQDPIKKAQLLQRAADKAAHLENVIDQNSCIDPCSVCNGLPCRNATGILNTDQVPAGSVLLTDLYYAANAAGLLRD